MLLTVVKIDETFDLQGKSGFGIHSFPGIGLVIDNTLGVIEQHEVTAMPLLEHVLIAFLKPALANNSCSLVLNRSLRVT
jgi:hypothetical protein